MTSPTPNRNVTKLRLRLLSTPGGRLRAAYDPTKLDDFVRSHFADPALLRSDSFDAFMQARKAALLRLIREVMGQTAQATASDPADDGEPDEEARLTMLGA